MPATKPQRDLLQQRASGRRTVAESGSRPVRSSTRGRSPGWPANAVAPFGLGGLVERIGSGRRTRRRERDGPGGAAACHETGRRARILDAGMRSPTATSTTQVVKDRGLRAGLGGATSAWPTRASVAEVGAASAAPNGATCCRSRPCRSATAGAVRLAVDFEQMAGNLARIGEPVCADDRGAGPAVRVRRWRSSRSPTASCETAASRSRRILASSTRVRRRRVRWCPKTTLRRHLGVCVDLCHLAVARRGSARRRSPI